MHLMCPIFNGSLNAIQLSVEIEPTIFILSPPLGDERICVAKVYRDIPSPVCWNDKTINEISFVVVFRKAGTFCTNPLTFEKASPHATSHVHQELEILLTVISPLLCLFIPHDRIIFM